MMPIRDVVIFPYMMTPFVVGRESSVRALEYAMAGDKKIFLATQHDASVDEPKPGENRGAEKTAGDDPEKVLVRPLPRERAPPRHDERRHDA